MGHGSASETSPEPRRALHGGGMAAEAQTYDGADASA